MFFHRYTSDQNTKKYMATMTINSSIFKPIIMKILKTMTNKASSAKQKRFHDFHIHISYV